MNPLIAFNRVRGRGLRLDLARAQLVWSSWESASPGSVTGWRSIWAEIVAQGGRDPQHRVRYGWHEVPDGRMYTTNPPIGTTPKALRPAFVAPPGGLLLGVDVTACHLALAAKLSGDPGLAAVCEADDPHRALAARIAPTWEPSRARGLLKISGLAMLNGAGPDEIVDIARKHGSPISKADAAALRSSFWASFPALDRYANAFAQAISFNTPAGRHVEIPPDRRVGLTPFSWLLQAVEADGMRAAVVTAEDQPWGGLLLLAQHDGLLGEAPADTAADAAATLASILQDSFSALGFPVRVKSKVGQDWGAL